MLRLLIKYKKELFEIHKKIFFWPFDKLIRSKNIYIAKKFANLKLLLSGSKTFISYDEKTKLFSINENNRIHYFGNLVRGTYRYKNGYKIISKNLFNSYFLRKVNFQLDDIVIDCGANYGDLWYSLDGKISQSNYITFEPGLLEHESIKKNCQNGIHNQIALSNKDGVFKFYLNEEDADSSLIEPKKFTNFINVKTMTLSTYLKLNNIIRVKFLKIESEGFEPEILNGAIDVLDKIKFIGIDVGPERGKNNDHTLNECCNLLLKSNFKIIATNLTPLKVLYQNEKLID